MKEPAIASPLAALLLPHHLIFRAKIGNERCSSVYGNADRLSWLLQRTAKGQMLSEPSGSGPGVQSSVLVPTRFVWPHGGRRVHLCGSFTRWQKTYPMSPVEGSSSLFQVICSLSPGYYKYKFIVDGEWRYDDEQDVMRDPSGNYNNFKLVREPEFLPTSTSNEVPTIGASMDVDHDMSHNGVLSAGQPQHHTSLVEGMHRVSVADAGASRQRIHDFLLAHTAYELLPESGKVIVLDVSLPVKQAFHLLYEQGIPVAPLRDSQKQQFVGMLGASDFIAILRQIGSHGAILSEEELETHTIAAWKEEKMTVAEHSNALVPCRQKPLVYVNPDDSLREVAHRLLQHQVAFVPVLNFPPQEPTSPQLLHLASLSGILKCLYRHFRHTCASLPLLSQPICTLPVGTWIPEIGDANNRPLAILRASAPLSTALGLLLQAKISAIPIVDDNGSLLDIYARSDITALARDRAYARVQLDQLTVAQALQIGQDGNAMRVGGPRCHMCLRTDSLQRIMERLCSPEVRRLICVEAGSRRVEGIVSLTDIFNFLLI